MEQSIQPLEIPFFCTCGNEIKLKPIGGQYQYSWQNECECGKFWYLENLSAKETEEKDETI